MPAATARLNSFFRFINPNDTIVLVMVVPTLAPIIIGMALCNEIEPDATKATTSAVVVELLCNMAVTSNPINNPVNGLDVAIKIVSAADVPKCCNEATIKSSAKTNSTSVPIMYNTLTMLLQGGTFDFMGSSGSNSYEILLMHWKDINCRLKLYYLYVNFYSIETIHEWPSRPLIPVQLPMHLRQYQMLAYEHTM